jgi:uncharacterized protein
MARAELACDARGTNYHWLMTFADTMRFSTLLLLIGAFALAADQNVARQRIEETKEKAEQGDATAQFNLGWCYAHGDEVLQDYAQAATWYRKAAEQGHAAAQYHLGWYYAQGLVVTQDHATAVNWYRKAAEQGNADAQVALGMAYAFGHGVEQDHAAAVGWYRKAAEQGDAGAQFKLGTSYMEGRGVARSDLEAYVWLSLAAAQAEDGAAPTRDTIAARLSSSETAEGQQRVAAFVPQTNAVAEVTEP